MYARELRTQTIHRSLEKVDCLSAVGRDNRWTVMRINSRSVEIVDRPIFQRSLRDEISANKQTVPRTVVLFDDRFRLSRLYPWEGGGERKRKKKKEEKEKCKHAPPLTPTLFPRNSFLDRLVHFFHLSAKNFSIFATLPPGCSRVSIFHFVGAESSDRGDAAQITEPSEQEGRTRQNGGKERKGKKKRRRGKKIKERGPRTRCERCDETVVYLYRRPRPAPSRVVI